MIQETEIKKGSKIPQLGIVFLLLVSGFFASEVVVTSQTIECSDGIDNDSDGWIDGIIPNNVTFECINPNSYANCAMWEYEDYDPQDAESDDATGNLPAGITWLGYAAYGC